MELIFEILFQLVGEVLLQIVFEALAELGVRSVRKPKKPLNPWLAAIGYMIFGSIAGGISLWLFPELFINSRSGQIASLVVTPIAAGAAMSLIGAWRLRRDQTLIRLDRFCVWLLVRPDNGSRQVRLCELENGRKTHSNRHFQFAARNSFYARIGRSAKSNSRCN